MAGFTIVRDTSLSAEDAWTRLTDWRRHGEHVPLTTVRPVVDGGHVTGFVARTGFGPLGFDDSMVLSEERPPTDGQVGHVRITKTGKVVLGWAELTVEPTARGSRVTWHEEARLRGTGGAVARLTGRVAVRGFERLLDALLEWP